VTMNSSMQACMNPIYVPEETVNKGQNMQCAILWIIAKPATNGCASQLPANTRLAGAISGIFTESKGLLQRKR